VIQDFTYISADFSAEQRQLIDHAHNFASTFIQSHQNLSHCYHNWLHTASVASVADALGSEERLPEDERLALLVAALFHDIGFYTRRHDHEAEGVRLFSAFSNEWPAALTARIHRLILETELEQKPESTASKCLRDADLHYLGLPSGLSIAEQLRKEWELLDGRTYSEREWIDLNIDFFNRHRFYTEAASKRFQHGKAHNLEKLLERRAQLDRDRIS
jgi:predicted metal-dependent HD superfamily phosphohydrolase